MYVKIMGPEDLPDDDSRHTFELFSGVLKARFWREGAEAWVEILFADSDEPENFEVEGNVYVMNDHGKTIATFGAASPETDLGKVVKEA